MIMLKQHYNFNRWCLPQKIEKKIARSGDKIPFSFFCAGNKKNYAYFFASLTSPRSPLEFVGVFKGFGLFLIAAAQPSSTLLQSTVGNRWKNYVCPLSVRAAVIRLLVSASMRVRAEISVVTWLRSIF